MADGKPLTAADVLYSLTIGRQDKAADRINLVGANSNIAGVSRAGNKVVIRFKAVDSTFLGSQLVNVPIVPKHIWSKVKDVVKFANPNPVGSGPFNRITRFSGQSYQLSKNKNYWAKGLPRIECVERLFTASNDAGLLQIVSGQADWTHNFVPNVETAYQEKDPKNFHNAYLTTGAARQPDVQHDGIPLQPGRLPQGSEPGHRPQDGVQARRVRLRTADHAPSGSSSSTRSGSTLRSRRRQGRWRRTIPLRQGRPSRTPASRTRAEARSTRREIGSASRCT